MLTKKLINKLRGLNIVTKMFSSKFVRELGELLAGLETVDHYYKRGYKKQVQYFEQLIREDAIKEGREPDLEAVKKFEEELKTEWKLGKELRKLEFIPSSNKTSTRKLEIHDQLKEVRGKIELTKNIVR